MLTSFDFADKSAQHDKFVSALILGRPEPFPLQMQPVLTNIYTIVQICGWKILFELCYAFSLKVITDFVE
jgi:hypothetical protein